MPASKSVTKAEERALAGENESQDSQLVLDEYMRAYGIGLMSSSPPADDQGPFRPFHHQRLWSASQAPEQTQGRKKGLQTHTRQSSRSVTLPLKYTETRNATKQDREPASTLPVKISRPTGDTITRSLISEGLRPGEQQAHTRVVESAVNKATPCVQALAQPNAQPDIRPSSQGAAASKVMDSSQSPTQSNDGRSYEQYFDRSPEPDGVAPVEEQPENAVTTLTQSSIDEQKSLTEDDTGAVIFNVENPVSTYTDNSLPSHASPHLDGNSLGGRLRNPASEQDTPQSHNPAPETPAVRHNPFAGNNHFQLVPTSQLFKATQYSSALRRASPTSSRPSPNDFPHNSISPNPMISSPLKARGLRSSPMVNRTSSPQVPGPTDSPLPDDVRTTPFHMAPLIPESPRYEAPKARAAPEPMGVYVPMHQSQERRTSPVEPSESASPELSDDGDDPIDRRRRARSKKEASLKRLTSIQFSRTRNSEEVEVPSTNRKKRKSRTEAQEYLDQCHGAENLDDDLQLQDRVENSQDQAAIPNRSRASPNQVAALSARGEDGSASEEEFMASTAVAAQPRLTRRLQDDPFRLDSTDTNLNGETIPETSPIEKQRRVFHDTPGATPSTAPNPSSHNARVGSLARSQEVRGAPVSSVAEYVPPSLPSGKSTIDALEPALPAVSSPVLGYDGPIELGRSSPALPALPEPDPGKLNELPSSPPAPAFSTRSHTRRHDVYIVDETPVPQSRKELPRADASVSTLSDLSSTPSMSVSATPGTEEVKAAAEPHPGPKDANTSPAAGRDKRRRVVGELPRLKMASTTESLRVSARLSRHHRSDSTDELAKSPSTTPTFEQSVRMPPRLSTSRPVRTSMREFQPAHERSHSRAPKLFDGMAFAISFQSKKLGESQDQYDDRMELAKSIGNRIVQAGGRVVVEGFDELFEAGPVRGSSTSPASTASSSPAQPPDAELKLTSSAREIGFTALVADGHSRKVKYMQALALGLPCIAARWITDCLDRNKVVDWAPYLLCAGESKYLGGAFRSRNLVPYDASRARLAQVLEARRRLLEGSRILFVMKKSEQGKKMAYVFLTRVLGASLCRAQSLEEARTKLKAMRDLGRPFDWVYVGGKVDTGELFADATGTSAADAGGSMRKRKRGGGGNASAGDAPPERIRTLSDELVIQSLILGRLIEEGEMEE